MTTIKIARAITIFLVITVVMVLCRPVDNPIVKCRDVSRYRTIRSGWVTFGNYDADNHWEEDSKPNLDMFGKRFFKNSAKATSFISVFFYIFE